MLTLRVSTREGETQKDRLADRNAERERSTDTSHQRQTQTTAHTTQICPLPGSHTFSQFRYTTQRVPDIYKHIQNRHTQITNIYSTKSQAYTTQNIHILRFPETNPTSESHMCTYTMQTHTTTRSTDTHAYTPISQDRRTYI